MDPFSINAHAIDNGFLFTIRKNGSRKKTFFAADILSGLQEACQAVVEFKIHVHRESLILENVHQGPRKS